MKVEHPQPVSVAIVGPFCLELAIDLVIRAGLRRVGVGGHALFTANDTPDARLPHQPCDRAAGDIMPGTTKGMPELLGTADRMIALLQPAHHLLESRVPL